MRIKQIFPFPVLFLLLFIRANIGCCEILVSEIDTIQPQEQIKEARSLMRKNKNAEALYLLQDYGKNIEKQYKAEQDSIVKAVAGRIAVEKSQVQSAIDSKSKSVKDLQEGNQDIDTQNKILTANTILFFSVLLTIIILILVSRFRIMSKSKTQLDHTNKVSNELEKEVASLSAITEKAHSELEYHKSAAAELNDASQSLAVIVQDKNHPVHRPAARLLQTSESIQDVLLNSTINLNEEEKVETNLNELIEEVLNQVYYFNKNRNPEFECTISKDLEKILPKIEVYPGQIRFVLFNLIENAVSAISSKQKSAPKGFVPTVSVSTRKLPRFVQIRVKDNGAGIHEKSHDLVFEPFFTTKNSPRNSGLGLTESKHIINTVHKGELFIESDLSSTTDFIIRFPTLTIM